MKKSLIIAVIGIVLFISTGCEGWNPLGPDESGIIIIPSILDVEIEINIEGHETWSHNGTADGAHVLIYKQTAPGEYIKKFEAYMHWNREVLKDTDFSYGDKIKIIVKVGGGHYNENGGNSDGVVRIERYTLHR